MYAASPVRTRSIVRRAALDHLRLFRCRPYNLVETLDCPYFEIHGGVRGRGLLRSEQAPVLSRCLWSDGKPACAICAARATPPVKIASVLAALFVSNS
jgi:hypothetical protein